ncbi:MAG: TetR/AcrR family transcriptional regulator [Pseudoclavibacter sp.]
MVSRISSTDPRAVRARGAIMEATLRLLETNAAGDISVGDIASRAGVSRQAFYSHFTDRQQAIALSVRDDILRATRPAPESEEIVTVSTLVDVACDLVDRAKDRAVVVDHVRTDSTTLNVAARTWHEVLLPWCGALLAARGWPGTDLEDGAHFLAFGLVGLVAVRDPDRSGEPRAVLEERLTRQVEQFARGV